MKMIYLATVYSAYSRVPGLAKLKMWYNWHRVNKVAMRCMRRGYVVFSPITHSHIVSVYGKGDLTDHDFWMKQDEWYVDRCDEVWILDHPEIKNSKGVQLEINWAKEQGKKIKFLDEKGDFKCCLNC